MNHRRKLQLLFVLLASNLESNQIAENYLKENWYETEIILFSNEKAAQPGFNETEAIYLTQQRLFDRDITFSLRSKTTPTSNPNPNIMIDLWWFRNTRLNSQLIDKPNWLIINSTKRIFSEGKKSELIQNPSPDNSGLLPIIEISPTSTLTTSTELAASLQTWTNNLRLRSFIWETDELTLTTEARRLGRNGLNIIQHSKWAQTVPAREYPKKALIQVGKRSNTGFQVEGYLSVTKSRYLHFEAKLWLSAVTDRRSIPAKKFSYAMIHESRRMRSKELHYIDHPLFGLLVTIRPIPIPTALTELTTKINDFPNNFY